MEIALNPYRLGRQEALDSIPTALGGETRRAFWYLEERPVKAYFRVDFMQRVRAALPRRGSRCVADDEQDSGERFFLAECSDVNYVLDLSGGFLNVTADDPPDFEGVLDPGIYALGVRFPILWKGRPKPQETLRLGLNLDREEDRSWAPDHVPAGQSVGYWSGVDFGKQRTFHLDKEMYAAVTIMAPEGWARARVDRDGKTVITGAEPGTVLEPGDYNIIVERGEDAIDEGPWVVSLVTTEQVEMPQSLVLEDDDDMMAIVASTRVARQIVPIHARAGSTVKVRVLTKGWQTIAREYGMPRFGSSSFSFSIGNNEEWDLVIGSEAWGDLYSPAWVWDGSGPDPEAPPPVDVLVLVTITANDERR